MLMSNGNELLTKDILVVEDYPTLQSVYQFKLTRWGYDFDLVGTGGEGLKLLLQTQYRLILLDAGLPDIDGREVCRRIRQDVSLAHCCQTPVLMITATADLIGQECLAAGATYCYAKSILSDVGFERILAQYIHGMYCRTETSDPLQR